MWARLFRKKFQICWFLSVFNRETVCFVLRGLQSVNFGPFLRPFAGPYLLPDSSETVDALLKVGRRGLFLNQSLRKVGFGALREVQNARGPPSFNLFWDKTDRRPPFGNQILDKRKRGVPRRDLRNLLHAMFGTKIARSDLLCATNRRCRSARRGDTYI
jgi:hypothetical protein